MTDVTQGNTASFTLAAGEQVYIKTAGAAVVKYGRLLPKSPSVVQLTSADSEVRYGPYPVEMLFEVSATTGTLTYSDSATVIQRLPDDGSDLSAKFNAVADALGSGTGNMSPDNIGNAVRLTVKSVDDVSALRATEPFYDGQQIELLGHTTAGIGGGVFYYDAADTTTADDNGVTIVTAGGKRWKRRFSGSARVTFFGVESGDSANSAISAIKAIGAGIFIDVDCTCTAFSHTGLLEGDSVLTVTSGGVTITGGRVAGSLTISGNNKTNNSNLVFLGGTNPIIEKDVLITGAQYNGVVPMATSVGARIYCRIDDTGGAGITPSFQGCGVYTQTGATDVVVYSEISNTRGQAACFFNNTNGGAFFGYAHDTYFRGCQVFGASSKDIEISCRVRRAGEINDSASGVGSNGIFVDVSVDPDEIFIHDCDIREVAENGIEASGKIVGNLIKDTGFYPALSTPSKEGIYCRNGSVVKSNVIINPYEDGISFGGTSVTIDDLVISENDIFGVRSTFAGVLGVRVSGSNHSGVTVTNNRVHDTLTTSPDSFRYGGSDGTYDKDSFVVYGNSGGPASPTNSIQSEFVLSVVNAPTYADNASAVTAGLSVGRIYKTATGELRIVY